MIQELQQAAADPVTSGLSCRSDCAPAPPGCQGLQPGFLLPTEPHPSSRLCYPAREEVKYTRSLLTARRSKESILKEVNLTVIGRPDAEAEAPVLVATFDANS